jgi:hypothetical protein
MNHRDDMKIIMESWRGFLLESKSAGKIIFLSDRAALVGVDHASPLTLQINDEIKERLRPIAEIGFYFEGRGDDVPKLKEAMEESNIRLGPNLGQWDKFDDIETDPINWAYTLFTGEDFESVEWPSQILSPPTEEGKKDDADGTVNLEVMKKFRKIKNPTAGDVILLMLTSKQFGPRGLGGLNASDARKVVKLLAKSGVNVDAPAKQITAVMNAAAEAIFPNSGDVEGDTPIAKLSKNVQPKRREALVKKLKKTGGIGLIGYSHLVRFQ